MPHAVCALLSLQTPSLCCVCIFSRSGTMLLTEFRLQWWPARIQPDKSGEFRTERTCHIEVSPSYPPYFHNVAPQNSFNVSLYWLLSAAADACTALQYLHPHAAVGCGEPEWVDRASRVVRFTATRLVGNSDASTEPDAQCTIALKLQGKTYDVDATGLLDSTETQERWLDEPDPMQALGILVDKDGSYASGTGKATTKQLKKAIKEALVQWVANKDRLAALSIEAAGSVADSPKRSRTRVTPFVAESATAHNRVVSPKRSPSKSPAKGAAGKRPAKRPAQPKKLSLGGDGDHSPVAGRAAAASSSEAEVEVTEQGAPVSRVKRARVQSNGVGAGAAAAGAAAAGAAAAATAMELDEVFGPASETASLSGLYPFASTRHPEFRTHAAPLVTSEKFSNFFKSEIGSLFEDAQAEAGQSTMAMLLRGAMAGTSPSAVPRAIELNMMWRTLCGDDASGNVDVAMATQFVDCFRRAAYWATEGHRDLLGNTEAAWQAYTAVISKVFGSVTVPPDHDGPPSPDFIIKSVLPLCPSVLSSPARTHSEHTHTRTHSHTHASSISPSALLTLTSAHVPCDVGIAHKGFSPPQWGSSTSFRRRRNCCGC